MPFEKKEKPPTRGGSEEPEPPSDAATATASAAALARMNGQTLALCRSLRDLFTKCVRQPSRRRDRQPGCCVLLGHDLHALGVGVGASFELQDLAQGADRDLELVEGRLARRQALEPQARCQERHQ